MYTHYFSLIYPRHIQLKEEAVLEFRFRNVRSSIMINRHRSSLGILDLFNSFERSGKVATNKNYTIERNSIFGKAKGKVHDQYYILERHKDRRVFYNYDTTQLLLGYDSASAKLDFDLAYSIFEHFIRSYRRALGDVAATNLDRMTSPEIFIEGCCRQSPHNSSAEGFAQRIWAIDELPFDSVKLYFHRYSDSKLTISAKQEDPVTSLVNELNSGQDTFGKDFILDAYEDVYVHKTYNKAILDAFTYVEIRLRDYVYQLKLKKGISKRKLDDYKIEVGIGYILNIEFPTLLNEVTPDIRAVIDGMDWARKLRNKIVHERMTAKQQDALDAISKIDAMRVLLNSIA